MRLRILVVVLAVLAVVFAMLWLFQAGFGNARWGTITEGVAAVGAIALLAFEIGRVAILERRGRTITARRVHAWLEPNQWTTKRQGVTVTHPAGWLLVVANDTDDVIVEWVATATDESGRHIAAVGSSGGDGSLPPRRPIRFELPHPDQDSETLHEPPQHYELAAVTEIQFRDRDGHTWASPSDGSVRELDPSLALRVPSGVPGARRLGPRGVERQGLSRHQWSE